MSEACKEMQQGPSLPCQIDKKEKLLRLSPCPVHHKITRDQRDEERR